MKKFHPGNEVKKLFWKAVFISSSSLYETYLQQIDIINEATGRYLRGILTKMWAQSAVRNPHFGHITSNIVESINSAWCLEVHMNFSRTGGYASEHKQG
jgi:hypothetical protein